MFPNGRPRPLLAAARVRALVFVPLLVVAAFVFTSFAAFDRAEQPGEPSTPPPAPESRDPGTPAGAIRLYLDACKRGEFARAATSLDLGDLPAAEREAQGADLARKLKVVLDRKLWIQYERLSAQPAGDTADGLPADVERIGTVGDADILLQRVTDAQGLRVWKVASSTVHRIDSLYDEFGYGPLGDVLPAPMFEIGFLGVQLWQWIGLAAAACVAFLFSWLAVKLAQRIVRPLLARTATKVDDELFDLALAPARVLFGVALFALGLVPLKLSIPAQAVLSGFIRGTAVLGATWLALRIVDALSVVARARLVQDDRRSAVAVIPICRRAAKVFLLVLALIVMLQSLGVNATGLIAGLGVGGLAFALAAQKTLSNLFGGISLIVDQPVRVGDLCSFGDGSKMGTVEEVGLRSTRIRTLDRTLVSVPNSEFSEIRLENYTSRDRIRLQCILGLRYETTPDQMRYVLAELQRVLVAHRRVSREQARARFIKFGAHSLDVEVSAYVETQDPDVFQGIREELYLSFMDVVENAGTGFAFPSQTLYMTRDGGLDAERRNEVERQVQEWGKEGRPPASAEGGPG